MSVWNASFYVLHILCPGLGVVEPMISFLPVINVEVGEKWCERINNSILLPSSVSRNVSVLRNKPGWETKILRWKNSGVSRILHGMQSEQQGGDTVGAVWRPANLVDGRMVEEWGRHSTRRQASSGARPLLLGGAGGEKGKRRHGVMHDDLIMMPRKLPVKEGGFWRHGWITGSTTNQWTLCYSN